MKKIVMAIVILLATTINCFAGNSVYIQQDNQDSDGSIFIKQDGSGNTFGYSTSYPFKVSGENITIVIKQIGDNNKTDYSNHLTFYGEDMTLDYTATGDGNKLRIDSDDTDATGIRSDGNYYGYVRDLDGNKITAKCIKN